MVRTAFDNPAALMWFEREPGRPLQWQVYESLRRAILAGRLAPGARLPASRRLAEDLGLGRNTVLAALDQLASEGYVMARTGSGTFVSSELPDRLPEARGVDKGAPRRAAGTTRPATSRGERLAAAAQVRDARTGAFVPGLADYLSFPFSRWSRLMARTWRRPDPRLLTPGDPAGYMPLREAIADHLRLFRGVDCGPEQVIISSGVRQGIDLIARVLLSPGDKVWLEEPGYPGLVSAFAAAGADLVPVAVDRDGLRVDRGRALAPDARFACVAPSHQHPLGVTMSLARRLDLLGWAREANAWLIEDDYDSEYRYRGRPLAALQGLDRDGRVIYIGSFSKVMFASLRLGYLVVPTHLADLFRRARTAYDDPPSMIAQVPLARFMAEGQLAQHIRRTRRLYAERQEILLAAAARHLSDDLVLHREGAGMHLVARFTRQLAARMDDVEASARAAAHGIMVSPLSRHYMAHAPEQGLLLGYAHVEEGAIEPAVRRLATALHK